MAISFFSEDTTWTLKNKLKLKQWIKSAIIAEGYQLDDLNFIFCSDAYLLNINQEYLKHDTFTDIITFDNSDFPKKVVGDIFISIDRIDENAKNFKVTFERELHRVMIHGVLHLLGYKDKKAEDKTIMTQKEDEYLSILG